MENLKELMSNKLLVGCHVSLSQPDYLLGSLNEAVGYGANCLMIYNGAPQNTIRPRIQQLKIDEFKNACKINNFNLDNLIVHAPYIINLATNDEKKQKFAYQVLLDEIKRTEAIGCKFLVVHPGNSMGIELDQAFANVASIINKVNKINKHVVICLETMSGKGTEVGKQFNDLNQIITQIKNKELIGICLDTCHMNDAGYDLKKFDDILSEINKLIGINYIKVVHLNDSKNVMNSHSDRHENIGYGTIGFKTLVNIAYNNQLKDIPKILETPYYDNKPPYFYEIKSLQTKEFHDFKKINLKV